MIQALSFRPQCLVEPNSAFLESGLPIRSDRTRSLVSCKRRKLPVYIQNGHGIVKRHSPVRRLLHRDEAVGRFVHDSEGVPISGRQGLGLLPQRERQG